MRLEREFVFDPSLVLYLSLYESDGASFMSRDKHGHLGTATGAFWTAGGRYFDGIDDKIAITDHSSFTNLCPLTVEAWTYAKSGGIDGRVIDKNNTTLGVYVSSGSNCYQAWRNCATTAAYSRSNNNTLILNSWVHYVAVLTADLYWLLYLNGEEISYQTKQQGVGALTSDTGDLVIGNKAAQATPWDGLIREVRVYNRALTPLEIQHTYLATKGGINEI